MRRRGFLKAALGGLAALALPIPAPAEDLVWVHRFWRKPLPVLTPMIWEPGIWVGEGGTESYGSLQAWEAGEARNLVSEGVCITGHMRRRKR